MQKVLQHSCGFGRFVVLLLFSDHSNRTRSQHFSDLAFERRQPIGVIGSKMRIKSKMFSFKIHTSIFQSVQACFDPDSMLFLSRMRWITKTLYTLAEKKIHPHPCSILYTRGQRHYFILTQMKKKTQHFYCIFTISCNCIFSCFQLRYGAGGTS